MSGFFRFTPLANALPSTVPFVGPEAIERARGRKVRARIGANAVVVKDVPPGVTMIGTAARQLPPKECRHDFVAYGTPTGDLPDPVVRALDSLAREVAALSQRVAELEGRAGQPGGSRQPVGEEKEPVEFAGPLA